MTALLYWTALSSYISLPIHQQVLSVPPPKHLTNSNASFPLPWSQILDWGAIISHSDCKAASSTASLSIIFSSHSSGSKHLKVYNYTILSLKFSQDMFSQADYESRICWTTQDGSVQWARRGKSPREDGISSQPSQGQLKLNPRGSPGNDAKHFTHNYTTWRAREGIYTLAPKSCWLQLSWLERITLNVCTLDRTLWKSWHFSSVYQPSAYRKILPTASSM